MDIESAFESFLQAKPYKHQLEAGKLIREGKSVVIRAPCGSGKTEACYIPFLMGGEILPARLIYSLPTRALVEDIAERIRKKLSEKMSQIRVSCHHGANAEDPFFKSDIIVTTIDQTIGAYCCTPLSLPVHLGNIPAGAAVASMLCFDEVHTYDYALGLQTILALIERIMESKLKLPFVIMSATLPDVFVEWFRKNGVAVIEATEEDIPKRRDRHVTLHWVEKVLEPKDVLEKINSNHRIIVVCNTVNRAQLIYSEIKKISKIPIFLLHSRFLEEDRKKILEEMKKIFKEKGTSCCLVATQVCEVGLDISCDVMLTELATPDALIQRIGRCARDGGRGEVYVFDVKNPAPYKREIINATRHYIKENLNGREVKWEEELKMVNSLLSDEFTRLMYDKNRRCALLRSLGDAAFKGERKGVEKTIREILNVNLTIHDAPEKLSYDEIRCMPWLSIDIRTLESFISKHAPKIWEIEFYDNEEKREFIPKIISDKKVHPHCWYVIDPSYANYSLELGLKLGNAGQKMEPIPRETIEHKKPRYYEETWVEHAIKCINEFESLGRNEKHAIELLSRVLEYDVEKIVAFCVGLHDIGKLNYRWQKAVGAEEEPLAHTCSTSGLPPHAGIASHSLREIINELLPIRELGIAFRLAMAHHHYTRAERIPEYEFIPNWEKYVGEVLKKLEKYGLKVDVNKIIPSSSGETRSPESFPNIENILKYMAYSITSRIIRICDRGALGGW
ncbi:MAG: CRISPR-associated helicase Cas3' [Candidatus Hadarchaeales archaeon]